MTAVQRSRGFQKHKRYGWSFKIGPDALFAKRGAVFNFAVSADKGDLLKFLHVLAAEKLPAGTRYELRQNIPENYGRLIAYGWYRAPEMDWDPNWRNGITSQPPHVPDEPPYFKPDLGYYVLGQFTVPTQTEKKKDRAK